jgi:NAD(P)-dependent dehydrogenase (short-subunit alcohol dehydrogenase family)
MKKILIVGGTGGLGSQVSKMLSNKYEVTSVGSSELDVRDMEKCNSYFKNKQFDIVLNMSGVNYDSFIHKLTPNDSEKINQMIDVNIKGTINLVSSCLPYMREQKYGRIILISSVLSEKSVVGTSIYSSCKSFLDKFVKNISLENIKQGITSNTIQLGYFDGGMTYKINKNYIENIVDSIGLKRFGSIKELCNTIEYLIENEYTTGINLKIDGGLI